MNKKIAIDLIKIDVLNCSHKDDEEALLFLKRNDENFPWKELGEYQNLIAILAATSNIEIPGENLKKEILEKACKLKSFAKQDCELEEIVQESEKAKSASLLESVSVKPDTTPKIESRTEVEINNPDSTVRSDINRREKPAEETGMLKNENKPEAKVKFRDDFILSKQPDLFKLGGVSDKKSDEIVEEKKLQLKNKATSNKNQDEKVIPEDNLIFEEDELTDQDVIEELESIEEDNHLESEPEDDNNNNFHTDKNYDFETKRKLPGRNQKSSLVIAIILIVLAVPVFIFLNSSKESEQDQTAETKTEESLIADINISEAEGVEKVVLVDSNDKTGQKEVFQVPQTARTNQPPPLPEPTPIEPSEININEDLQSANTDLTENIIADEKTIEPPPETKPIEEEPVYFMAVEEMPEPIGGIQAIQSKIKYPEIAKKVGVQGKVYVTAFVDETGTVTNVELLKGLGAGCDEEAMNAVHQTKFKPGKQRGKPVKVRISIPIVFKLR
jgi:protein TonB